MLFARRRTRLCAPGARCFGHSGSGLWPCRDQEHTSADVGGGKYGYFSASSGRRKGFVRWDDTCTQRPELSDRVNSARKPKPSNQHTVIVESARCECLTYRNDVGMPYLRPRFNGSKRGLLGHSVTCVIEERLGLDSTLDIHICDPHFQCDAERKPLHPKN